MFFLGTIDSGEGYPFLAYLRRKLENLIKKWQEGKENGNNLEYTIEKEGDKIFFSQENIYIPEVDYKSENGAIEGWYIRTFAGIVNVSVDTLRRWDKDGYLIALKVTKYRRVYTEHHRKLVEEIKLNKQLSKRHKIKGLSKP